MTETIVYTTETCPKCSDEAADVSAPRLPNITCAQTEYPEYMFSSHRNVPHW